MGKRVITLVLMAAFAASASIIEDVRASIAANDFALGDQQIKRYREQRGLTPELIAAISWMGRGALAARKHDQAEAYARQTESLVLAELKTKKLDQDPFLPVALGAALEVRAQVLAGRGERDAGVLLLREALRNYGATSIRTRIQKNINLLSLEGKKAPELDVREYVGPKPAGLAALRGKPVILFFWAHWCGDCKSMAPLLARLLQSYPNRFHLVGPTQHYGVVAEGKDAPREIETRYIEEVRAKHYSQLPDMAVPVSEDTFRQYGCSTTPTFTFVDRTGIVRLYRPGKMTYEELDSQIKKLLSI